jgi:DNA repair protein RadB
MPASLPEPLDSLLKGIEPGAITNFFGEAGTGKTNMCLLAAISCARAGGKVIYIDTEGGFSLERLKQLAPDWTEVLGRMELLEPHDFTEQGRMVRSLMDREASLVVVDSAVALYRLDFSEPEKESLDVSRELSRQMSLLSMVARKKGIPVLITGHAFTGWDKGGSDIVGGGPVKYWSKAIVFLEKTGRMSERKATVIKHRSLPEGESAKFVITGDGISPSGGFRLIRRP